jgi:hypothetical protein
LLSGDPRPRADGPAPLRRRAFDLSARPRYNLSPLADPASPLLPSGLSGDDRNLFKRLRG